MCKIVMDLSTIFKKLFGFFGSPVLPPSFRFSSPFWWAGPQDFSRVAWAGSQCFSGRRIKPLPLSQKLRPETSISATPVAKWPTGPATRNLECPPEWRPDIVDFLLPLSQNGPPDRPPEKLQNEHFLYLRPSTPHPQPPDIT